jgi:hypothetical protein
MEEIFLMKENFSYREVPSAKGSGFTRGLGGIPYFPP